MTSVIPRHTGNPDIVAIVRYLARGHRIRRKKKEGKKGKIKEGLVKVV